MPDRILRDWTDSANLEGVSPEGERLFVRLIMKVDDFGRFHGDSRLVKSACFPLIETLRTNEVDRWLDELSTRQLVLRYEANGRKLLAVVNFGQRLRTVRAKFPPPEGKPADWLATCDDLPRNADICQQSAALVSNPPQSAADCRRSPQIAARREGKRNEVETEVEREREGEFSRARSIDEMLGDLPEPEPTPKPREQTPAQEAMQRINGLKPEWAKPSHWTAAEMHELHGSLSAVCELTATDWDMMRRYLVAKLPQGAGYWQPPSRSQFVKAFCDVFQHAQRWSDKQGGSYATPQNNNLNPYA